MEKRGKKWQTGEKKSQISKKIDKKSQISVQIEGKGPKKIARKTRT